jgi:hypothetical protein
MAAAAFREVLHVAASIGVDVLPVKGIVLAHTLYERPEERPMLDVDLRVRPDALVTFARAARARGWMVRSTSRQLGTIEFPVARTLIEVETTVGPPGVCKIGIAEMISRSSWQTGWLGVPYREPELHDHALLLCINAFKDKLVLAAPSAREDLLRISCKREFSPTEMTSRVLRARLRTLVWLVVQWIGVDPRVGRWREVADALAPPRRGYAALFSALARRWPYHPALAVVARAVSDDPWWQTKAVALMAAGTLSRGRTPTEGMKE